MRVAIPAFGLSIVASAAFAESTAARIPRDTMYSLARTMMMRQGFEVVKVDPRDDGLVRCAPGREEVCSAYPETRACLGTGLAKCEFMFTRKGKGGGLFVVETQGEDIDPKVTRVRTLDDRAISRFLAE